MFVFAADLGYEAIHVALADPLRTCTTLIFFGEALPALPLKVTTHRISNHFGWLPILRARSLLNLVEQFVREPSPRVRHSDLKLLSHLTAVRDRPSPTSDNRNVLLAFLLASSALAPIHIEYPAPGAMFPPEITAPTFLWRDDAKTATAWRVDIAFNDGSPAMRSTAKGEWLRIGPIDPDCIAPTNKLPTEIGRAHV